MRTLTIHVEEETVGGEKICGLYAGHVAPGGSVSFESRCSLKGRVAFSGGGPFEENQPFNLEQGHGHSVRRIIKAGAEARNYPLFFVIRGTPDPMPLRLAVVESEKADADGVGFCIDEEGLPIHQLFFRSDRQPLQVLLRNDTSSSQCLMLTYEDSSREVPLEAGGVSLPFEVSIEKKKQTPVLTVYLVSDSQTDRRKRTIIEQGGGTMQAEIIVDPEN